MEQEVKWRNRVETVMDLSYIGERMKTGDRHRAAVVAYGWECVELTDGNSLPLKLKNAIYENIVMSAIMNGSEELYLKERY